MIFLLTICLNANAQKLPNIQQVSLRVPANVKIDGKADEWGELKAYNKNTQVYYTVSNDLDNLYLIVDAADLTTIKKILAGGITFTLNQLNKNKNSTITAFTFPYYSDGQKPMSISSDFSSEGKSENKLRLDSFAKAYNRQMPGALKLIGVRGLKDINDRFITIYNEENVKAAASFNKEMHYIYELAVPLKLLGYKVGGNPNFNYNLQLNGQTTYNGYAITPVPGRSNLLTFTDNKGTRFMLDQDAKDLYYPTDFWGEYTLAK